MPFKDLINRVKLTGEGEKSATADIPPNILAFRTITTLLAQIPRATQLERIDYLEDKIMTRPNRRILKISDAFAHISVGPHNVTAVATNHTVRSTDLQVLVTAPSVPASLPSTQPNSWLGKLSFMWTQNDQWEDPSKTPYTKVICPSPPGDLGGRSAGDYLDALDKKWIEPPLRDHLWLLCKVLNEKPVDLPFKLSRYIAAMYYKRIARRFRNNTLSQPYLDSLKRVKVEDIPPYRKQAIDDCPGAAHVDKDEFDSDRLFLQDFLSFYKEYPTHFGTKIEHLLKKADESLTAPGHIELYTDDTRIEFHNLLLVLLYRFERVLDELVPRKKQSSDGGNIQPLKPSDFKEAVENLHLYAYGLLKLARGRAFRLHLENIETLLDDPCRTSAGASTHEHNEEHDNARDEEQEEDFDGVLPPQKLKSYVAWLRVIVGHFDAVEILARFVSSDLFSYDSISIKILVIPPTVSEKLDWRKLFTDGYLQNKTILEFLNNGVVAVKDRNTREAKRKQTGEKPEIEALKEKLKQHPSATNFFRSLGRSKPLIKGAHHCEVFLASLLPAFTESLSTLGDTKYNEINILPDMKDFGSVIGVSKRCCPTCDHFLKLLRNGRDDEFLVRGRHGNISACTLPVWTPSHIVDAMNDKFGPILIQDLSSFMEKVNGIQDHALERSQSTGSGTLSLDSNEEHGGGSMKQWGFTLRPNWKYSARKV